MSPDYKQWAANSHNEIGQQALKGEIKYVDGKAVFKSELESLVHVFKEKAHDKKKKKPLIDTISDSLTAKIEGQSEGVYLVVEGYCEVVLRSDLQFAIMEGDCFGDAAPLKSISYEYLGDIRAGKGGVRCQFISREAMKKIPMTDLRRVLEGLKHEERRAFIELRYNEELITF